MKWSLSGVLKEALVRAVTHFLGQHVLNFPLGWDMVNLPVTSTAVVIQNFGIPSTRQIN